MSNTAVITFGRMNPITIGHEKLVNKVKHLASELNATPLVYLSHSNDSNKNPLPYLTKVKYAMQAFGECVQFSSAKTLIDIVKKLDGKYDNIVVVGDLERSQQFEQLLNKYNGKEYSFDTITTVSAGSRSNDNDLIDGMSATKMRSYAINNDIKSFTIGLPDNIKPYAETLIKNVRKGLNYE